MKHKKRRAFRIGKTTSQPIQPLELAMSKAADHYSRMARKITPLIRGKAMRPPEALLLISLLGYASISGRDMDSEMTMTEEEVHTTFAFLLTIWKKGMFHPGPDFPFTLQQTLKAIEEDESREDNE